MTTLVVMKSLAERVIEARKHAGLSQVELARQVGVSQQTIHKLEDGRVRQSRYILEIAAALNVDPTWLKTGKAKRAAVIENEITLIGGMDEWDETTPLGDDEVEVPLFREVEMSAGSGRTQIVENHGPKLRFAKSTLRRAGVMAENVGCAYVSGNSMEPRISDGSTIGIDKGTTQVRDGKVYAIDHDGMLRVKYLYRLPGGGIKMASENDEEHPSEEYTAEQLENDHIRILGRVFWWSVVDI